MTNSVRKITDKFFALSGICAVVLMVLTLVVVLTPIIIKGAGAIFFTGTIEHRRFMLLQFERGDRSEILKEISSARATRQPVYEALTRFENDLKEMPPEKKRKYRKPFQELKQAINELLGPDSDLPDTPILMRNQYGQMRWDNALQKLQKVLYKIEWDYSDTSKMGMKRVKQRAEDFKGTFLEEIFVYIEKNITAMLIPQKTVYWQFWLDPSFDSHFFGGIFAEMLGTFYLATGAILFAFPFGVIAALYLAEYAKETRFVMILRSSISTLAGVPSVVFGLFGLAFFINTLKISHAKSVLAGSLTLALMILPTIIKASEEAIKAVPKTYKEASLSLGASRWHTIWNVLLPAALPGILTGFVISAGRAAGETAPIIFTAAVSVGKPLNLWQTLTQPTPALSWNIYNLATEHSAAEEIRHVQYGIVLTLVLIVLILNFFAIVIRARLSKKLKV
jgi:phosphate transport system permease protein